jgi:uncharacterized membrane protein
MKIKTSKLISFLIIIVSFGVACYFYPLLPDTMVSHWGAQGEADGYSSKAFGLFFMPILATFFTALLMLIPKLDPLKKNIEDFQDSFDWFIVAFNLFLFYLYALTIVFNLGYTFNMIVFLAPSFAFLFYYMGIMISKAKRNYFIGIRTPWTLASDKVWEKTHKLGGLLFKLSAVFLLLSIFNPGLGFLTFIVYILAISLWLVIYSYLEFRKLNNES